MPFPMWFQDTSGALSHPPWGLYYGQLFLWVVSRWATVHGKILWRLRVLKAGDKSPYLPANSIPPETSLGREYGKGRRQWPVGSDVILSKCVDSLVSPACLPALCFLMFCVGRASWQRSWLLRCFLFLGSALYLSHPFRYWSVHSFIKPGSCSARHTVCNWPLAGVDRVAMTGGRRVQLLSQVQNYSSCSMNSALHTCKSWYCIYKNKKEFETPRL